MSDKKDTIFSVPGDPLVKFTFDEKVADVFPDMIQRSVPGYGTILAMIGVIAGEYVQANSNCYDLGSSLGACTLAMRKYIREPGVKIIAVDNSSAMIERSRKIIDRDNGVIPVELIENDIRNVKVEKASVVVLNFTLQFIPDRKRSTFLKNIYKGMKKRAVLILSEKIHFQDEEKQKQLSNLHWAYKKANGYSDLEIAQKRTALENVLVTETFEQHRARLKRIGFEQVLLWFKCFNFISILAFK